MAYIALYRNYRPTNFDEVAGQKHIIKTLKNAVVNSKISHAYLFSGQRGIGKTTIARILAKAVNCLNPINGEPCNECANCKMINNNETPDVIELDAASNNGVDEMRYLLEKVNFLPSSLNKKVYIIDEVHMLSISAFNALLKTLEEPPVHVMFILATTEPHKIPMTILSRCQRFDFKQLTNKEIVSRLEEICLSEDINIEQEALSAIADAAEGGMRDAVNILDQVNSYANEIIKVEDIDSVTGRVSNYKLIELINAFKNHDATLALKIVDELVDMGKEISRLTNNLVQFCRDILLYKNNVESLEHKNIYDTEDFKTLVKTLDQSLVFFYIDTLMDVVNKLRYSNSSKIYLEVAVMKIVSTTKEDLIAVNKMVEIEEKVGEPKLSVAAINPETELKVGELELKVSKIIEELNKLNIQDFKDLTLGKINLLEEVATTAASLPKQFSDKFEELETKIASLNIGPSVVSEKYDDSALLERIEKIETKPEIDLSKYDKLAIQFAVLENKLEELNASVKVEEEKVVEEKPAAIVDVEHEKAYHVSKDKISEIEENIDQLMAYIVDFETQNRAKSAVSNTDLIKYQNDVKELKENYFTLIQKIVNSELTTTHVDFDVKAVKEDILKEVLNNITFPEITVDYDKVKTEVLESIELPTVDNSMNEEILNDIIVKYESLREEFIERKNLVDENVISVKELLNEKTNELLELKETIALLTSKVQIVDTVDTMISDQVSKRVEETSKDLYKYVDDVKDYNLKLSLKINELQKNLTKAPVVEKEVVVEKVEVQETKPVKEIAPKEEIKENPVKQDENTVVVKTERKVVEKEPTFVSAVKEVNETEKVFDVSIVEKILHESRREDMRQEKINLVNGWNKLANNANNTTAPIAKLLRDGSLIANGENSLLIVYAMATYCNRLMSPKVHKEAKDIIKITFGKEYDFIALPENTWQEKRKEYYSQYGIGIKYPKLTPINNPELKVVVVKEESENKDRTFDKVTSIFGFKNVRRED